MILFRNDFCRFIVYFAPTKGGCMRLNWRLAAAEGNGTTIFWRILGALLLGVLLARWSWTLFAPHAEVTASVSEHGVAAEAARLFGVADSAVPAVEVLAWPNVRLLGVFAAGAGKASFAVFDLDGKQVGVALGENLVSGIKLAGVHADHVLLERAGVSQRVDIETGVMSASGVVAVPVREVFRQSRGRS